MRSAAIDYALGLRALADRDYARAAEKFAAAQEQPGAPRLTLHHRIYAHAMAGQQEEVIRLLSTMDHSEQSDEAVRRFMQFIAIRFGLPYRQ
jgi:hypothetical protein